MITKQEYYNYLKVCKTNDCSKWSCHICLFATPVLACVLSSKNRNKRIKEMILQGKSLKEIQESNAPTSKESYDH